MRRLTVGYSRGYRFCIVIVVNGLVAENQSANLRPAHGNGLESVRFHGVRDDLVVIATAEVMCSGSV